MRRAQFQAEKEAELEQRKDEERREASRKVIIEQERQRLLQEHASKLLGYLPRVIYVVIVHYIRIYGSKPPRTRAKPRGQGWLRCHKF